MMPENTLGASPAPVPVLRAALGSPTLWGCFAKSAV